MNATMRADDQRKFKMYAKNVANYKLKGQFFDAYHLGQFVNDEQNSIFNRNRQFHTENIQSSNDYTSFNQMDNSEWNFDMNNKSKPHIKPSSQQFKTRKDFDLTNISLKADPTSIRPSHYFISIPRTNISYKKSEVVNNDSVLMYKKKNKFIINDQLARMQENFTKYDNKLKSWKQNAAPTVASEKLKEARDLTNTLREYQNLKRAIMLCNRRTNFSNNRWREEIGNVLNPTCNENSTQRISQRAAAYYNFEIKNQAKINKSVSIDINWTRKRKCKSKSLISTFERIQSNKQDKSQVLALRDSLFCFKKCRMDHTKPRDYNIVTGSVSFFK